MNMSLVIKNHGPLILSTNYWGSEAERAGKYYISTNAGTFRVLVPNGRRDEIPEMRPAKGCAVSRGPFDLHYAIPHLRGVFAAGMEAIEILFDDGSDSPFALHLSPESFDRLPGTEDAGREFILSVWTQPRRVEGPPHKVLERPCLYRISPRIPDLRPWEKK